MLHISRVEYKRGFTLAEVLIVLVIAALIAAIGIPSLTAFVEHSGHRVCSDNAELLLSEIERRMVPEQLLSEADAQSKLSAVLERLSDSGVQIVSSGDAGYSAVIMYGGDEYGVCWSYSEDGSIPDLTVCCETHDMQCKRSVSVAYISITMNKKTENLIIDSDKDT